MRVVHNKVLEYVVYNALRKVFPGMLQVIIFNGMEPPPPRVGPLSEVSPAGESSGGSVPVFSSQKSVRGCEFMCVVCLCFVV